MDSNTDFRSSLGIASRTRVNFVRLASAMPSAVLLPAPVLYYKTDATVAALTPVVSPARSSTSKASLRV